MRWITSPGWPGNLLAVVALRDWPASKHFPAKKYRPTTPDWVTEHAR